MKITIGLIIFLFLFTFLFTEGFAQGVDLPNDFGTIVYESAGRYYVKDSHDIITSNNEPDIVIKTALARGGDIYIAGGTYKLSQYFSGLDLQSHTHLKLAQNAFIIVPSGYEGYVFQIKDNTFNCVIEGGNVKEADPVKRNWIGILLHGGSISFNLVENMFITDPFIVININATSPSFISANTFYNISGIHFVRGIEFDFIGKLTSLSGIFGNTFRDLQFQSGNMTTYGVKDIKHFNNAFYNVIFWDLPPNAISANIDPSAINNVIIGGAMTSPNFDDKGHNTIILDKLHTKIISSSPILLGIVNGIYRPQANMPIIPSHQILNMNISSELTSGFVSGNQGQLSISPGNIAAVNIFGMVTDPKGGLVVLSITRPDGVVEQNYADITSSGAFSYPMIFDKNSLTGQYMIVGSYQNSNLGTLFLNMTSHLLLSNETNAFPNIGIPASESGLTPSVQIKNDAKLWSQDKISDDVFSSRIQYLIKIGIIEKPKQTQTMMYQSAHIPSWLKNNASMWANGQISASDFISEIQYLLNNEIMIIH
jgi:hypothetical protein